MAVLHIILKPIMWRICACTHSSIYEHRAVYGTYAYVFINAILKAFKRKCVHLRASKYILVCVHEWRIYVATLAFQTTWRVKPDEFCGVRNSSRNRCCCFSSFMVVVVYGCRQHMSSFQITVVVHLPSSTYLFIYNNNMNEHRACLEIFFPSAIQPFHEIWLVTAMNRGE